ncbi:MAG: 1-deoxy-D-xylulose-5-phosphate reductoisomerase, partial [Fidelibacterota bacterium]
MSIRKISILGSTGSIGLNALKVVENLSGQFEVAYLSCRRNSGELLRQVKKFRPRAVAILDRDSGIQIQPALAELGVELLSGREGLLEIAGRNDVNL